METPFIRFGEATERVIEMLIGTPLVNHFSSDVLFVVGGSIKIFLAEFKSPVFSEVYGTLNLQIFSEMK